MEYYSALAKRRREGNQSSLSPTAAPSSRTTHIKGPRALLATKIKRTVSRDHGDCVPKKKKSHKKKKKKRKRRCFVDDDDDDTDGEEIKRTKSDYYSDALSAKKKSRYELSDSSSNGSKQKKKKAVYPPKRLVACMLAALSDDNDGDDEVVVERIEKKNREEKQQRSKPPKPNAKSDAYDALCAKKSHKRKKIQHTNSKGDNNNKISSDDAANAEKAATYPIGTRLAKSFHIKEQPNTSQFFYGSITKYNSTKRTYSILFDDGDKEDNISEVEMATLVNNAAHISSTSISTKCYTIGTRIAKVFFIEEQSSNELCYGKITRYNSNKLTYSVLYDDGDNEDISVSAIDILVKNAFASSSSSSSSSSSTPRVQSYLSSTGKMSIRKSSRLVADKSDAVTKHQSIEVIAEEKKDEGGGAPSSLLSTRRKSPRLLEDDDTKLNALSESSDEEDGSLYDDAKLESEHEMVMRVNNAKGGCKRKNSISKGDEAAKYVYPTGARIAKEFFIEEQDDNVLCYGYITNYNMSDGTYSVEYDDGDTENITEMEMDTLIDNVRSNPNKNNQCDVPYFKTDAMASKEEDSTATVTPKQLGRMSGKKYRMFCYVAGCTNLDQRGGICKKHETEELHKNDVPPTNVRKWCYSGNRKKYLCSHKDCGNQCVCKGVCKSHSHKVPAVPKPKKMGLNSTGRSIRLCSINGCTKKAVQDGRCMAHVPKELRKMCSTKGCNNLVNQNSRGVCQKHSGYKRKRCSTKGCDNFAVSGGVCCKHGPLKKCSYEGCTNKAISRGVCIRHGAIHCRHRAHN